MTAIQTRIVELAPKLQRTANYLAGTIESDDLLQDMTVSLLEKSANDPLFAEQKDGYLLQYATWTGKHASEAARTYNRNVFEETIIDDDESDLGSSFDAIPDLSKTPEEIILDNEQNEGIWQIVKSLSIENQKIIAMISLGESQQKIAAELHISKAAVSQRKATIARALQAIL
ncbi:MAG: sigma-70 family RNA polymerase sigma factor [Anaerolineaceae bacterium]|nr:sigma-70 family RNA polymerase sigma factor [Anaerolineaceae bacterium]